MRKPNNNGVYNVMYTKQVNGSYTTRLSIPQFMLRDLGVSPLDKKVKIERVENGILIKKAV